jgi:hypothetical protein
MNKANSSISAGAFAEISIWSLSAIVALAPMRVMVVW